MRRLTNQARQRLSPCVKRDCCTKMRPRRGNFQKNLRKRLYDGKPLGIKLGAQVNSYKGGNACDYEPFTLTHI